MSDAMAEGIIEVGRRRCEACEWKRIAQEIDSSKEWCGYRGKFWWEDDLPFCIREMQKGRENMIEQCPHWEGEDEAD